MCMDERCRHPYTCDCEEQCGGEDRRCFRCDERLESDEFEFCDRCKGELDELDW